MRTDEDLTHYIGAHLLGATINDATSEDDAYGVLETIFFKIQTDKGEIDFSSHNSHNGYYGGVGANFKVLRSLQSKGVFR